MPQWTREPSHATQAQLVTQPLAKVWNTLANSSLLNLPSSLQLTPCRPSETDNHENNENPHIQSSHKPPPVHTYPCTFDKPDPPYHQGHEDLATQPTHNENSIIGSGELRPQPISTCREDDRH